MTDLPTTDKADKAARARQETWVLGALSACLVGVGALGYALISPSAMETLNANPACHKIAQTLSSEFHVGISVAGGAPQWDPSTRWTVEAAYQCAAPGKEPETKAAKQIDDLRGLSDASGKVFEASSLNTPEKLNLMTWREKRSGSGAGMSSEASLSPSSRPKSF